jgi:hypothetical protein
MYGYFEQWFGGKIEKNLPPCQVRVSRILEGSQDTPYTTEQEILDRIGMERAELHIAHFCRFLEVAQTSYWYCGFAKCVHGHLRTIFAGWYGDQLYLSASNLGFTDEIRNGGYLVCKEF